MAIPSSELPFSVVFQQGSGRSELQLAVNEFCTAEELLTRDEPMLALTENLPLRLQFTANGPDARLYLDGFESVPQERLAEDSDGMPYLPPGRLILFNHEAYSWIPGLYRLEVQNAETRYCALIQVVPKELSMAEWVAMRDELEKELRGLALDLTSRRLGLGLRLSQSISPQLLHRFLLVRSHFPRVMAALADLEQNVNQRVRKVRNTLPREGARQTAARAPVPQPSGRQAELVAEIDYDLPENRCVKHILGQTDWHLQRFLCALRSLLSLLETRIAMGEEYSHQISMQQMRRESELLMQAVREYERTAEKMLRGLRLLRRARWYQEVGVQHRGQLPQALQSDGRYNSLYELFRQLQKEDWQPALDQSFHYQWKRTDRLYEIWCVIQLCRILASLGFTPQHGWLYDQDFSQVESLVPDLPAETSIAFKRGLHTLRLTYDQEIPRQSSDTELPERPVYTQDVHNRPDIRLDIYHADLFVGCLIIDCKYRPLRGFWRAETLLSGYDRPKAMSQLISYGMAIRSRYLYGQKPDWAEHRSQVVLEVWALHPGMQEEAQELYLADHRMRMLCLRPGLPTELLARRLQECLARA